MNIRLQKYKKNRILGMNRYNSALAAGYSLSVAKVHTNRLEEKLASSMNDYLERVGLTDKQLAQKLSDLIEATKTIGYLHQYKKGEKGRIEKVSADEVISNEFLEVPDRAIQRDALKLALQVKGHLKENFIDQSQHIHRTNVYLNPKALEEEKTANNRIASELSANKI